MSKINVLDKHTAELIAAGEVVERPSSVLKELMENAIDAGASSLCVEIQCGGVRLMRITDNGMGISREDVPIAFLRHATSKVKAEEDLEAIHTLGFRGEALASICAVSRVELLTRTEEDMAGTRYIIEGGDEQLLEDCARPQGTTIVVRDLFYNVPARMKFLKKDVSESNSVAGVVERVALSHPEVSVRFIRDGKDSLLTPGDGKLLSCIYTVFGKKFAADMIPLEYTQNGIHVYGYICKPGCGRANRTMQHFYINGRYVKTRTAMAALEEAYKGAVMVGKFPSCVINIDLPPEAVDVNVHPAKIEVRFINERPIFDAVYHGVKSAIMTGDVPAPIKLSQPKVVAGNAHPVPEQTKMDFRNIHTESRKTARSFADEMAEKRMPDVIDNFFLEKKPLSSTPCDSKTSFSLNAPLKDSGFAPYNRPIIVPNIVCDEDPPECSPISSVDAGKCQNTNDNSFPEPVEELQQNQNQIQNPPILQPNAEEVPMVMYLGEAFSTYIIAQMASTLYIIDKHAAHERILYDEFKSARHVDAQMLLSPAAVTLSREEYAALTAELEMLNAAGFEIEEFGDHSVLVRAVPMLQDKENVSELIQEIAGGLAAGKHDITTNKLDWIYHSAACRAAIKAGDISQPEELKKLAERVLLNDDIRTCPHGRPVCFELSRHDLEKQFGRVK